MRRLVVLHGLSQCFDNVGLHFFSGSQIFFNLIGTTANYIGWGLACLDKTGMTNPHGRIVAKHVYTDLLVRMYLVVMVYLPTLLKRPSKICRWSVSLKYKKGHLKKKHCVVF